MTADSPNAQDAKDPNDSAQGSSALGAATRGTSVRRPGSAALLIGILALVCTAWIAGLPPFAPRAGADTAPPETVLDSFFVIPPNYTNVGYTPRELIEVFAQKGLSAHWERGGDRLVLRITGRDALTRSPIDTAFRLRPVSGPHEIASQAVGFEGPAVVVEGMAEQGVASDWITLTNLFEGMQMLFLQNPNSRMNALLASRRTPPVEKVDPRRFAPNPSDRPVILRPTVPR